MATWKEKATKLWSEIIHRQEYCQICGSNYILAAHHLITKSTHGQYRCDVGNGILLCQKHHNYAHANNNGFMVLVKQKAPKFYDWYIAAIQEPRIVYDENGHVAKFGEDYYEKIYYELEAIAA